MKKLIKKTSVGKLFTLNIEAYYAENDDAEDFYLEFCDKMRPVKLLSIDNYDYCEFEWIKPFTDTGTPWDVSFSDDWKVISKFLTPYHETQLDVELVI